VLTRTSAELAHQWFGNLVTMDWWNELWLNEGFATWVGWLAVDHFYPGKFFYDSIVFYTYLLTRKQSGMSGLSLSYAILEVNFPQSRQC
jgi:aminopeptidase N